VKHPVSYISEHLLLAITLAFISGIALSPLIGLSETNRILFCALLFSSLVLLAILHYLKRSKIVLGLLIPVVFGIGCYHGYVHQQIPADENHIYNRIISKSDVVLIGTMSTMADFDGKTSQVTIEAKSLRFKENSDLLPTTGKILLRLKGLKNFLRAIHLPSGQTLSDRTASEHRVSLIMHNFWQERIFGLRALSARLSFYIN
jgi:hypothetical protein